MEAYAVLIIMITIMLLLQENSKTDIHDEKSSVSYVIVYISLVVFYIIREGIGYDYEMYKAIITGGYAWDVYAIHGEIISAGLMEFSSYCEDSRIYFAVVSMVAFYLIIKSLYENNTAKQWVWGILVFMALPIGFIESLSIQRQFLAMSVLMYGIKYIYKGSLLKYLLSVIIATTCHMSSAIFVLLYIVRFIKIKSLFISGVLLISIANFIIGLLADYIIQVQRYLQLMNVDSSGGWGQYIFYIAMLCIGVFFRKYVKDYKYDYQLKIYMFGIIIMQMFMGIDVKVAFRFGGVALYSLIFMIPKWIYCFKESERVYVKLCVFMTLIFMFVYNLYISVNGYYLPFKTWL